MHEVSPGVLTCIFAHPDDEAFGPGGAIAHFARFCPTHLICVTNGDGYGDTLLGQTRRQELQRSADVLGVQKLYFLDYHDGSLCNNNYHTLAADLQSHLDKLRPDTVMTFDPNGVSGHLDHIAVSMVTSYLFEKNDFIRTLMYFCMGDFFKASMRDYFVYVPPGYATQDVDVSLDVSSVYSTKLQAMKMHVSQKQDCDSILRKFDGYLEQELFRIVSKPK